MNFILALFVVTVNSGYIDSQQVQDINDKVFQSLIGALENVLRKFEDQQQRLLSLEQSQRTILESIEAHRRESQLCAKEKQPDVVKMKSVSLTEQQQKILSLELSQRTILETIEAHRRESQLCAKEQQLDAMQSASLMDECLTGDNVCSPDAICTDRIFGYSCRCPPGFHGNGYECIDVDECLEDSFICEHNKLCLNTKGGYDCICQEGYRMENGSCQDVNECLEEPFTCSPDKVCSNTEGSYECNCRENFKGEDGSCKECQQPSVYSDKRGCIFPLLTEFSWNEARTTCHDFGMRLLENFTKNEAYGIYNRFVPITGYGAKFWVGIRNFNWISSQEPVPKDTWSDSDPHGNCGYIGFFGVHEAFCQDKGFAFCHFGYL